MANFLWTSPTGYPSSPVNIPNNATSVFTVQGGWAAGFRPLSLTVVLTLSGLITQTNYAYFEVHDGLNAIISQGSFGDVYFSADGINTVYSVVVPLSFGTSDIASLRVGVPNTSSPFVINSITFTNKQAFWNNKTGCIET